MVEFKSVQSSNIQGVHYDDETKILTVEFIGGSRYQYHDVPEEEHQSFMDSPSKGSYFANNIRDSYKTKRV